MPLVGVSFWAPGCNPVLNIAFAPPDTFSKANGSRDGALGI